MKGAKFFMVLQCWTEQKYRIKVEQQTGCAERSKLLIFRSLGLTFWNMDFLVKILFFCFIFCLHLAQSIRCQGKAAESVLLTKISRRWNDKSLIWWFSIWYEWIFCSLFIFSLPPWSSEKYYATHNISAYIYMLNHWLRFICFNCV